MVLLLLGCNPVSEREEIHGTFGAFYGGQVQRLNDVAWDVMDKPALGFRLEFPESAQSREHALRWELVRPGPEGRRVTVTRELQLPAGRERVDQLVDIPVDAPLGTVNLRVLVDGQLLVDRALLLRRN